jgi:SAM-dependent methyltransferase
MSKHRFSLAPLRDLVRRSAIAYSKRSRTSKAERFCRIIRDDGVRSVLLVGAESATFSWSNIIERAVIGSGAWVVVSGLGPDLDFPVAAVICDGLRLPFADQTFDLVLSNAVIEHVGDAEAQATFVAEHRRVGRSFIITTPNRWFPVESHTRVIARHWSPAWRASREEFTRLMSAEEFRAMLPPGATISGHRWSPTFTAYVRSR